MEALGYCTTEDSHAVQQLNDDNFNPVPEHASYKNLDDSEEEVELEEHGYTRPNIGDRNGDENKDGEEEGEDDKEVGNSRRATIWQYNPELPPPPQFRPFIHHSPEYMRYLTLSSDFSFN
ncbi:hypothetical protein HOY82DRAFT_544180 [Tuber indicum]|nr:hypothetical protein HOY82DRAFT_544180 [Tuber indicum]